MSDHLDRLRAALEAGPTPGPWETKGRKIYLGVTGRQGNGFPPDDEDYEEWPDSLGIIYDEGGHSVMDAAYIAAASPDVIAALLSERDALAAVAEAARTVTVLSADLDRWDERNGYVINSERDYLANNLSTAWDRLRDTLAAYDRTVAKP